MNHPNNTKWKNVCRRIYKRYYHLFKIGTCKMQVFLGIGIQVAILRKGMINMRVTIRKYSLVTNHTTTSGRNV